MPLHLIPQQTRITFMAYRKLGAMLSLALLMLSAGLIFTKGLNFGIDFTGGALVQIQTAENVEVSKIRNSLKSAGLTGLTIQKFGAGDEFLIRLPLGVDSAANEAAETIKTTLNATIGGVEVRRVEFVGPQVGSELRTDALYAIIVSLIVILIYISARFEMRYAMGAVIALAHDVFLTVGVFALVQKEVTLPVLAAILTVIGYSLNDTIVVFDRIRENRARQTKTPLDIVMNTSLNQTLNRTLMTSLTTLIVLLALFFYGGDVIHDFAFTLMFGVLVGTYSSVFIASPVVLWMEKFYQRMAAREALENNEEPKNDI